MWFALRAYGMIIRVRCPARGWIINFYRPRTEYDGKVIVSLCLSVHTLGGGSATGGGVGQPGGRGGSATGGEGGQQGGGVGSAMGGRGGSAGGRDGSGPAGGGQVQLPGGGQVQLPGGGSGPAAGGEGGQQR